MNTQDFIKMEEQYGAHNYHPLDVVIERAEGVWVIMRAILFFHFDKVLGIH